MSTEHGQSTENGARSTESTDVGPVRAPKMTQAATRSPERMREIALAREAAKRARRRAAKLTSAETRTIVQVEPERLDARVTPPVETTEPPVAARPVPEPVAVAPAPEVPRDPVSLWQIHPALVPDPLYPEMTTAPFGFERHRGKAYVLRLGRRLEVTPWFPWSAETSSTLYLDGDGRVYQDVQPEGWEPVVVERRPLIDPRRATSDSWGRQDDGREVQESRGSQILRGWSSAQSRSSFEYKMEHGT